MTADVRLIAAIGRSGQLGLDGKLPWGREIGDLPWFREQTRGHVVVIGERTLNAIEPRARDGMASDRTLYRVQTRWIGADGGLLEPAKIMFKFWGRVIFVAGGARVYDAFAPHCTKFIITRVDYDGPADTWFDPGWLSPAIRVVTPGPFRAAVRGDVDSGKEDEAWRTRVAMGVADHRDDPRVAQEPTP